MDNEIVKEDLVVFVKMQRGDPSALEYFFQKYLEILFFKALGIVKDKAVAEDIVQEVFIRFWDSRSRLNISVSVFAYLKQAVSNACINYLEHVAVEQRFVEDCKKNQEEEDDKYDAEELENLRLRLHAFLDTLPEKCREIFILACVEGLKYREIAERLNVSENTVKTQVRLAYRRLRSEFSKRDLMLLVHIFFFSIPF